MQRDVKFSLGTTGSLIILGFALIGLGDVLRLVYDILIR